MFASIILLLQPLDLGNIPGVPYSYIPTQGAQQAWGLYQQSRDVGRELLPLILTVSFLLYMMGAFAEHINPIRIVAQMFIVVALLSFNAQYVFGPALGVGNYGANRLFPQSEIDRLNREFREAAEREETDRQNAAPFYQWWFEKLAAVTATLTPGTAMLTQIFLAAATILFHVAVIVTMLLWRLAVIVLFGVSPILISLGALPYMGERILGSYIAALFQISFCQILMAICAFMVRTGDAFFTPQLELIEGRLTLANHFESIAMALGFTVIYFAIFPVARALLPISYFTSMMGHAFSVGAGQMAGVAKTAASAGAGMAGAAAGMAGFPSVSAGLQAAGRKFGGGGGTGATPAVAPMGPRGGGGGGGNGGGGGQAAVTGVLPAGRPTSSIAARGN